MSSKRRRAKKTPDPTDDPVATPGSAKANGDEGADGDEKKTKAEGKRSLPAFGFAGDLLKKKDAEEAAGATDDDADDDVPGDEAGKDLEEAELEEGDLDEADPHRIFSFADQLQNRQDQQEKDQGPKAKWETWVTFSLNDETFALPVEPVRQVVRVANITRVPHAPRPIRGVTNLRGRVIPVIDLRMRVGLEPSEIGRQSRVVAVASRGRLLGLLVDAVHQVVHIDLNKVQPPPEDVMTIESDYILGVYHQEESLILLLDVDRALVLREEAA